MVAHKKKTPQQTQLEAEWLRKYKNFLNERKERLQGRVDRLVNIAKAETRLLSAQLTQIEIKRCDTLIAKIDYLLVTGNKGDVSALTDELAQSIKSEEERAELAMIVSRRPEHQNLENKVESESQQLDNLVDDSPVTMAQRITRKTLAPRTKNTKVGEAKVAFYNADKIGKMDSVTEQNKRRAKKIGENAAKTLRFWRVPATSASVRAGLPSRGSVRQFKRAGK